MSKNGLISLIALIVHGVGFALYLYVLYNVDFPQVYTKGCMWFFIAIIHLFLVIDEWEGVTCNKQHQFNTINKSIFIFNFIAGACTTFDLVNGVLLMSLYLIAVITTSVFILKSGLQHGYFKEE